MSVTNNISTNHPAMEKVSQELLNTPQRYSVNPNAVDKTPEKDTVQISNKKDIAKKAGIGAAIIAAGVGLFCLLKGRKPSKAVTNAVSEPEEKGAKTEEKVAPKMEMTEDAKNVYDDVSQKLHKKTQLSSETVDANLVPKEKPGAWSKDDMKEYYTQLEKESDAKIAAEKAAKEAEAKAAKEAEAKKIEEPQKAAEIKKIKEAEKAKKYVAARNWGVQYADEHMDELDKLFLDKDGKFIVKEFNTGQPYNFYDLITPYDGKLCEIYHGTSPETKSKILQEGFRQDVPIAHGNLNGVGGTYFALDNNANYGSSVITAKFNGKVGVLNTEVIEYIFKPAMIKKTGMFPKWKKNADLDDAVTIRDNVIIRYMQNKLKEMGYQGIISDGYSAAAGCKYFSALDPKLIEIVK